MPNPWANWVRGTGTHDVLSDGGDVKIMEGKKSDDIYLVSHPDTTIVEYEGEGTDEVRTELDWTLGSWIENLTLSGSTHATGTGNELDNVLLGNLGDNTLYGLGGNDAIDGGGGDDSLYGGDGDDRLTGGAGSDLVDGGDGVDTAVFAGLLGGYSLEWQGSDLWVTNVFGETDIVRNVEFLAFDDTVVAISDIGTSETSDSTAPQAVDDADAGAEETEVVVPVLVNDLGRGLSVASATNGAKGLVTVNDDGTVSYRPNENTYGTDTFSYTITDSTGRTSTATVTVDISNVNDAPVAGADSYAVAEDQTLTVAAAGLLANDSDADGDTLYVTTTPVQDVAHGSLTLNADGSFTYVPEANFFGEDSFTYEVSDGQGGNATATVTLTVDPVNDAPVAVDDSFSTTEGTELSGAVLDNDSDPDVDLITVSSYDETTVEGGTVLMAADGTFGYTPASGFTGTDSFGYAISDGNGGSSTATVSVTVDPADSIVTDSANSTIIDVSDAAGLMVALESAQGGETIRLAPGDYGLLKLNTLFDIHPWADWSVPVTITSQDPENMASFSELDLDAVGGMIFDTILFDMTNQQVIEWYRPFMVSDSHDITIRNSIFDGAIAEGVDPKYDGFGIARALAISGERIAIEDNEFVTWSQAINASGQDIVISGNLFHELSSDGITISNVQGILIEGNEFRDFRANTSGQHRDMIQFWTTNETTPSTDITIRGNELLQGTGDWTQSIFINNEEVNSGRAGEEMFYQNILIEDNVIHNSHAHGITVGETDGLIIQNNTVLQNGDYAVGVRTPKINIATDSQNVTVTENIAAAITAAQSGWIVSDNLLVQRQSPSLPNFYGDLFVNALDDALAEIADLQALPGGLIETQGYGAATTRYDATPDELTALVRPTQVEGDTSQFSFDAGFTADPTGPVADGEALFFWDFGDGTTGEGITATHDYSAPGTYVVTLEVTTADGTLDTTEARIEVPDPLLLDVDVENGMLLDTSSYAASVATNGLVFTSGRNGNEAVALDADSGFSFGRNEIDQIFDLDEFSLSFGLRADAAGEILRIHTALEVKLNADGQIVVTFTNAAEETFTLFSEPGLLDGEWHNVTVTFDGIVEGSLDVYVDGALSGATAASGRTQPMESWGLSVGTSWQAGFSGEFDALEMRNEALEAADIEIHHDMLTYDGTFDTL